MKEHENKVSNSAKIKSIQSIRSKISLSHNRKSRSTDPNKIEVIQQMDNPKKKQEFQWFLGLVNYAGKFIPNLSQRTTHLQNFLERNPQWNRNYEHDTEIYIIKNITSNPTFQLLTSISKHKYKLVHHHYTLGAYLMQDHQSICYASRHWNSNYGPYNSLKLKLQGAL